MQEMVVCFPIRNESIFLGKRKKDPWLGKFSGFGGRVRNGEGRVSAQIREFYEETGIPILPGELIRLGKIKLELSEKKKILHIFIIKDWDGKFKETSEMIPHEFPLSAIPYDFMVKGDEIWIPLILDGYYFEAELKRGTDLSKLEMFKFTFFSSSKY
jgi:ADP-ribose pyrophosphatase YjhB (NUDIX family)